jgi:hypothetical protein
MQTTEPLEKLLTSIPVKWTAWELRTLQVRNLFVFELSRLADDNEHDEQFVTCHGPTPAAAIRNALANAEAPEYR